jgi:alpha-glucosidase
VVRRFPFVAHGQLPRLVPVGQLGVRCWPAYAGRVAGRSPLQWSDCAGGGFTAPEATPWLPLGDTAIANVEDQERDPESPLILTRALIALRRELADLRAGAYSSVAAPDGVWAWRRGKRTLVVVNLSDREATLDVNAGRVLISTDRTRVGEKLSSRFELGSWEGVIAER